MTVNKFLDTFWRYYLILERKFEITTQFVEVCEDNYSTYSLEFVNQIQTICSEIDVIMKSMCGFNPEDRKSITDYALKLLKDIPDLVKWEVTVRNISFKPFEGWDQANASKSLKWWDAYQHVKHGRDGTIQFASLQNTLISLMALYLLERIYYKRCADLEEKPDVFEKDSSLFSINAWESQYISVGNGMVLKVHKGALDLDGGTP